MTTRGQDIASVIKRQIEEFGGQLTMVDVGVTSGRTPIPLEVLSRYG